MLHHLVINYLFHFNRELGLNVGYCINNQISHITQPFPFLHLSNCTLLKLQRIVVVKLPMNCSMHIT